MILAIEDDMENIFYHVSKVPVNIGDYLMCGRYGKRIAANEFDAFHKHKETVFEVFGRKLLRMHPHA